MGGFGGGTVIVRVYSPLIFPSDVVPQLDLPSTLSNVDLPNVPISGVPADAVWTRVAAVLFCNIIQNTSLSGSNGINGACSIRIKKSTGAWGVDDIVAIDLPDNLWLVPADTRESGRMILGKVDVKSEVDENGTYNPRFQGVAVDYNYLRLIDLQFGLQVWFY